MSKDNKGGRPTKYKKEFAEQAYKLALLGATDEEMADFFNISRSTLSEWKVKYKTFSDTVKKGKLLADSNVAESLYKRATGYSHSDVDIKVINNEIVQTPLTKHYPPDTAAAIFWLKNRNKSNWREKSEVAFENLSDAQLDAVIEKLTINAKTQAL